MLKNPARPSRSRSTVLAAGLIGAVLLPLSFSSASAAPEGGAAFTVRAEDTVAPAVYAQAGMEPTAKQAVDTELYSYQCGPMEIKLTESMVAQSEANWSLFQAGDYAAMAASPSGVAVLGDKNNSQIVSRDVAPSAGFRGIGVGLKPVFDLVIRDNGECSIADFRGIADKPVGALIAYSNDSSEALGESRIVELPTGEKVVEGQALTPYSDKVFITRFKLDTPDTPYEMGEQLTPSFTPNF